MLSVITIGQADTTALLKSSYEPIEHIHVTDAGLATSANTAAAMAQGEILLFLAQPRTAAPGWIDAHQQALKQPGVAMSIGHDVVTLLAQPTMAQVEQRLAAETQRAIMRQPGYRFQFRDLAIGNIAIRADVFRKLGGFHSNSGSIAAEDFAIRLLQAGYIPTFTEAALAYRAIDSRSLAEQAYTQGQSDARLVAHYPDVAVKQFSFIQMSAAERTLYKSALHLSGRSSWLLRVVERAAYAAERAHLRREWQRATALIRHFWYWRGFAEMAGGSRGVAALIDLVKQQRVETTTIQLEDGILAAELALDALRPARCRFCYLQQVIFETEAHGERLRGAHLRPLLAAHAPTDLLALFASQVISQPFYAHAA